MSRELKQFDNTPDLARWYDEHYLEMGDGWNTPAAESNRHLDALEVPFDRSKTLLDVGFGAGHFLAEAEKRVQCLGLEISEVGIQFARKRLSHTPLLKRSIELPLNSDSPLPMQLGFDYIVSIGSLEHIVNIHAALDNIRKLLKPAGLFYFYCPNERWKHFDQPNERTMTDKEWMALFYAHGLNTYSYQRWNDNTAFIGGLQKVDACQLLPGGNKLNVGSGQRRFDSGQGWINVDCVSRPPDQVPDLICDVGKEPLPYPDGSMDYVVLHQMYEHMGLGEGHGLLREAHRVLKVGGSLIITVPDARALAQRWLTGQLEDYLYFVNMYGAYQSLESDRHRWAYTYQTLRTDICNAASWSAVGRFDWRQVPGSDIARDWYIIGLEANK